MANEVVFVGAGPIGLWTAIQIKLQNPQINIVFKERKASYSRTHTLLLKPESFHGCVKDEMGVIQSIIDQLKMNPHIRTNELEKSLRNLALNLGIIIDLKEVNDIDQDVLKEHPEAALIIGSDGVRSKVRTQVFGDENTVKEELAYSAQIKYSVKGEAVRAEKIFETYPLLKHSNYVSFINVGKQKDGTTPVTIQFIIDKKTYELIRAKTTYSKPIKIFTDDLEDQLPLHLLNDIKTQLGFRLNNDENIIIDDVNLTATELPQQKCEQVTLLANDRYYGVIGDAALALSYFKGMNKGLQLGTKYAKAIVTNWDKIVKKERGAFDAYEQEYKSFAAVAFKNGHKTNKSIFALQKIVNTNRLLPFQVLYFDNEEIADFHRHFSVIHQTSQFYLDAQLSQHGNKVTAGAQDIKNWLKEQMPLGLPILKNNLLRIAEQHKSNPKLYKALINLSRIDPNQLDFYEKAYLGLALSKTRTLLESPSKENYESYTKFVKRIESVKSSFSIRMSTMLWCIAGCVAVTFGAVAIAGSLGLAGIPIVVAGALLGAYGIYKIGNRSPGLSSIHHNVKTTLDEHSVNWTLS
jgi:2-polyprenyl-6-methoxyphenol hydroxylase-like FAD-dependent oxidoreductase